MNKLRDTRLEEFERLEKRRLMTEQERQEDDERLDKLMPDKIEKTKFVHLQKYHHGGAYYQDKKIDGSEPIYRRNVNEPLASEKYDKALLPKSMQVRRGNYGLMGQVKHTSLKDADTTDWGSAWIDPERRARREKFDEKQKEIDRMRAEKIAEGKRMGQR